jgi:hypothetical protein
MVVLTDPPVDAAPTAPKKRGGGPRTPRGLSMDPNRYEVSEPELLRGMRLF